MMYGKWCAEGQGVAQDFQEAAKYFKIAADQGHVDAQYFYGVCLLAGLGVEKDEKTGAEYLQRAASQGHVEALNMCQAQSDAPGSEQRPEAEERDSSVPPGQGSS